MPKDLVQLISWRIFTLPPIISINTVGIILIAFDLKLLKKNNTVAHSLQTFGKISKSVTHWFTETEMKA